jgi:hypothetical protein
MTQTGHIQAVSISPRLKMKPVYLGAMSYTLDSQAQSVRPYTDPATTYKVVTIATVM